MTATDKFLEEIDNSLKDKKETEVYAILFVIFLMVAGLSYTYLFPLSEEILKNAQKREKEMSNKLKMVEAYLKSKRVNGDQYFYVKKLKREIKEKSSELALIKEDSRYVDSKLKELRHILYDKENWSKFIDSISLYGNIHNLKIDSINSKVMDISKAQSQLKQVLDIEVKLDGTYTNILKFINDMEQSKLVVDLYGFNIMTSYYKREHSNSSKESKENLTADLYKYPIYADIKISVWGMIYDSNAIPLPQNNQKKKK